MSRWRSLHVRLAAGLLLLLVAVGGAGILATVRLTRVDQRTMEQRIHRDLAGRIAAMKEDRLLHAGGTLRDDGLGDLFHWLMVVNPRLELYLLDPDGDILAFDAPEGAVRLDRVDLGPVARFLAGEAEEPVFGVDPRRPEREAIFSAAALGARSAGEDPVGYLYVVLDGGGVGSALEEAAEGSARRLAVAGSVLVLALGVGAWLLLYARLTRPLRRLLARMRAWHRTAEESEARLQESTSTSGSGPPADEVEELERTFDELTARIDAQMAEIRRIETLRRDLVANVSHDLRTPLTAMRGYLDTLALLEPAADGRGERDEYLRIAIRHAERLGRLVDELFELTRLDSREVQLRPERFSMAELVQDNVHRFRIRAEERGVRLVAELGRAVPPVEADLGLIERVLENLIENALRHTPAEGSVTVRLRADGSAVEVAVADTGPGIRPEEVPRLFERWTRGPGGRTGLGLAIARRILELHRSDIAVESRLGDGSTFSFRLAAA